MIKKLLNICLVFALFLSTYGFLRTYQHSHLGYLQGSNVIYNDGQVLGINSSQSTASGDFNKKIADGSPLIFGGAHYPKLEQQSAWNQIQASGVTSLRSDFYLDRYLPQNITLEDYKNNINGVQDPKNWNQTAIKLTQDVYKESQKRNMKTVGVLTYAIKWLTFSGTNYGVPKDWDVYEDLVRKSYALYRDNLDYLEIWNEPDSNFFLDTKNSGLTREEAYRQVSQHAIKAIRQVDAEKNDGKRMQIGIGTISQPMHASMLSGVFADKTLMSEVDFVTFHNYENQPEPSQKLMVAEMQKYGVTAPLWITEWAHNPNIKVPDLYQMSDLGISYAGSKFISYLNTNIQGANYFALQQIDPDSKRGDEGYLGFFTSTNGKDTILPISKAFTLMSKTLDLGGGPSVVYETTTDTSATKMASWKNTKDEYGVVISNDTNADTVYNVTLYNYPVGGQVLANAFVASSKEDGTRKLGTLLVNNKDNQMSFKVVAPSNSLVGVTFGTPTFLDRLPVLP